MLGDSKFGVRTALAICLLAVVALGIATPGHAGAQTQGIQISGATPTSPLQLLRGCNQVIANSPNGAQVAGLVTLVSPSSAVVGIWRFNNSTHHYQAGWFSDSKAPTDFAATGTGTTGRSTETYFVCTNKAATMVGG